MLSKTNQTKLERFIRKYKLIQKSPYSQSYYSEGKISWGSKPEGSYRLSDHWNFYSQGEMHCKTTCGTTNGWYVGIYHDGIYTLIEKVFTDEEMAKEERIRARIRKQEDKEIERKRKEKERLQKIIDKGVNAKIRYTTSSKSGRYFKVEEHEEVCYVKGCWAYTCNGRKRAFKIVELL